MFKIFLSILIGATVLYFLAVSLKKAYQKLSESTQKILSQMLVVLGIISFCWMILMPILLTTEWITSKEALEGVGIGVVSLVVCGFLDSYLQ